ncbi:mitochondrial carrier [Terfezia boudieri ATCC MYA-4762]|uniref:Mitochondrial carrier n=1 Tax=Terfezia boudieri ATCC MYA-4762 TaxID=1051890 RepID=A0A3N4LU37_9PEZI|nr:mitochondrial carrier [Terfezia boudieri ATCC MYA-4762]
MPSPAENTHTPSLPPATLSLLSGAVAGTTVDTTLFPLDTLKTRLQSRSGFLSSGGFRHIYSGLGPVVLFSAPSAALFFVTYDTTKRLRPLPSSSAGTHMVAASLGELAACLVRVPTEVLKQRAQAKQFGNAREAFREIWALRRTGWGRVLREMYRGGGVTVMREIPFTVIQFPLWEALKSGWAMRKMKLSTTNTNTNAHVTTPIESALFGSLSGALAALITTPLDVLKTRIMLSRRHLENPETITASSTSSIPKAHSAGSILREILREEGPRALMKGWAPRVMWISIGGAVFLGAYDAARAALERL